jgi:hypothetical protein
MDKVEQEKEEGEQLTDVLSASEGAISGARITWTKSKKSTTVQDFGQPEAGQPTESTGGQEGAVVAWSYDAEKKSWTAKVEKGDAEDGEIKKHTKKKHPFKIPFIPNKEVGVGETWEVPEADLREFFADDDTMKVKEVKASCKAEEITATKAGESLKVSFSADIKCDMQNEELGNPEVTFKLSGHYMFNIGASRSESVEVNMEMSFSGKINTPKGAMDFTFKGTGKENKSLAWARIEKKEGGK